MSQLFQCGIQSKQIRVACDRHPHGIVKGNELDLSASSALVRAPPPGSLNEYAAHGLHGDAFEVEFRLWRQTRRVRQSKPGCVDQSRRADRGVRVGAAYRSCDAAQLLISDTEQVIQSPSLSWLRLLLFLNLLVTGVTRDNGSP